MEGRLIEYRQGWQAEEAEERLQEQEALEAAREAAREAAKPKTLAQVCQAQCLGLLKRMQLEEWRNVQHEWLAAARIAGEILTEMYWREDISTELKDASWMFAAHYTARCHGEEGSSWGGLPQGVQEVFSMARAAVRSNPLGMSSSRFFDPNEFRCVLLEAAEVQDERLCESSTILSRSWARVRDAMLSVCSSSALSKNFVQAAEAARGGGGGDSEGARGKANAARGLLARGSLDACSVEIDLSWALHKGMWCKAAAWERLEEQRVGCVRTLKLLQQQRIKVDSLWRFAATIGRAK